MGLFLAVSGVIGASSPEVQEALRKYAQENNGVFQLEKGTTDDQDIGVITCEGEDTTVLYPSGFDNWDDVSQFISKELSRTVFSFHIHDGDFWMYVIFDKGEEVGNFNPLPEYWGELPDEDKEKWKGDPDIVAELVSGVSPEFISKYLVEWDLERQDEIAKAYPDDEFTVFDCWQMCDFMRRIGLEYPMSDDGTILVDTFRFCMNERILQKPQSTEAENKPWWKFW